jgi:hypothetical protein
MSRSANVSSIDAIRQLEVALHGYESDMREAITQLLLEMRRALEWIEKDRAHYWHRQIQVAMDAVNSARINLERAQLTNNPDDKPACYEQKKVLALAKRRLDTVEQKVRTVREWRIKLKQEADDFSSQLSRMTTYLDLDYPRAVAALKRMTMALDKYAERLSPAASASNTNLGDATRDAAGENAASLPEKEES